MITVKKCFFDGDTGVYYEGSYAFDPLELITVEDCMNERLYEHAGTDIVYLSLSNMTGSVIKASVDQVVGWRETAEKKLYIGQQN